MIDLDYQFRLARVRAEAYYPAAFPSERMIEIAWIEGSPVIYKFADFLALSDMQWEDGELAISPSIIARIAFHIASSDPAWKVEFEAGPGLFISIQPAS